MEEFIYPLPAVQREFEGFVRVQLYTDGPDREKNGGLQTSRFHTASLPLYVILDADGNEVARRGYTKDPQEFVNFLKQRPR